MKQSAIVSIYNIILLLLLSTRQMILAHSLFIGKSTLKISIVAAVSSFCNYYSGNTSYLLEIYEIR